MHNTKNFMTKLFILPWLSLWKVFNLLAIVLLLCLIFFGWLLPVYAAIAIPIDPRLEEQVLQIIRDRPEVIVESVQAYQRQEYEQQQQAQQAFLQQMKANPQGVIGNSPTTGADDKRIVLLEFSDFQCPYCGEAHSRLKRFMANHQREVTLVYKHFPLTAIHPEALPAAKAAWAAGQQGKFWQYHDVLFEQQKKLGEALYVSTAKKLNLDLEQFNRDRTSNIVTNAIEQDMAIAQKLGLTGTPFFVMNGEAFSGAVQLSDLEAVLKRLDE